MKLNFTERKKNQSAFCAVKVKKQSWSFSVLIR
jgi:hypothetical protein